MADDWAGLAVGLGKMQQAWYVAARSYWSVFDQNADTATIIAEDGSTRQVPSWRAISGALGAKADKATTLAGYGVTAIALDSPYTASIRKTTVTTYDSNTYSNGTLTLSSTGADYPSLGLHRPGKSGVALVHKTYGADTLMLMEASGNEYRVWHSGNITPAAADADGRPLSAALNCAMANGDNSGSIRVRNAGGTGDAGVSAISFECAGVYGTKLALRNDGIFGVGGWSAAPWRWFVDTRNGNMVTAGVVNVGYFTRATLPAANSSPSGIAYITDGPNGPIHVFSNGQKWRVPTMTDL
ncbi:Uncharacterized protein ChrSV_2400 [Chromobacterium vaccinii]|nr:Uncharacterized protein ChrSW_2400 [Chromobacterium vaccinii]QND89857.1 Uncharacterized protein ChrSV_2400 [Chromobacterium vaccinii]